MSWLVTLSLSATPACQEKFEALASTWAKNQATHAHVPLLKANIQARAHLEDFILSIKEKMSSLHLEPSSLPIKVTFNAIHNMDAHTVKLVGSNVGEFARKAIAHFASVFADPAAENRKPKLRLYGGDQAASVFANLTNNAFAEKNARSFVLEADGIEILISQKNTSRVPITKFPFNSPWGFRFSNYIDGQWAAPVKGKKMQIFNPATGLPFHRVAASTAEDVDVAVQAAKKAFPSWSETPASHRAQYLNAIADEIEKRKESFAALDTLDGGKSIVESTVDVSDTVGCFRYYAEQITQLDKTQNKPVDVGDSSVSSFVRHEAMGVAALIIPWNYPLLMAAWKVAPCLAAGCTAILKPSELTPLSAMELAACIDAIGLPPGVFNLVLGNGPDTGSPLSSHPQVDKVAFTGSVATGSRIATAGAKTIKKVSLELGGKSPLIVCRDADLEQACDWILAGIFLNSGQICSATSRVLVHESVADKLLEMLRSHAKKISVGDGLNEANNMGPVVSEGQYTKVMSYINSGIAQGATLFYGGARPPNAPPGGYFILPTIFVDVKPFMRIWQEEIFGPVLSVMTFENEEEAIRLANDTPYGLGGAVFSQDNETAQRISRKLRCGIVWINCSQPTYIQLPWGGFKQSGTGRELGPWGLHNYLEVKQVSNWVNPTEKGWGWYHFYFF